jgi:hypothetical protein
MFPGRTNDRREDEVVDVLNMKGEGKFIYPVHVLAGIRRHTLPCP